MVPSRGEMETILEMTWDFIAILTEIPMDIWTLGIMLRLLALAGRRKSARSFLNTVSRRAAACWGASSNPQAVINIPTERAPLGSSSGLIIIAKQ